MYNKVRMQKTGAATLPLHYGKAPRWLFSRMVALLREITIALTFIESFYQTLQILNSNLWVGYWYMTKAYIKMHKSLIIICIIDSTIKL